MDYEKLPRSAVIRRGQFDQIVTGHSPTAGVDFRHNEADGFQRNDNQFMTRPEKKNEND